MPSARDVMNGKEREEWQKTMRTEVNNLVKVNFWAVVKCLQDKQVLLTKFVIRKKRDNTSAVQRLKARFVVCGNEVGECDDAIFSPVPNFRPIKLVIYIAYQRV